MSETPLMDQVHTLSKVNYMLYICIALHFLFYILISNKKIKMMITIISTTIWTIYNIQQPYSYTLWVFVLTYSGKRRNLLSY